MSRRLATSSRRLARIPGIKELLGADEIVVNPSPRQALEIDQVVGWGMKRWAAKAERYARRYQRPFARLEDGFLRSLGLGVDQAPPFSIVVDEVGIYYDATQPSRLEQLLQGCASGPEQEADPLDDPTLLRRARDGIETIVTRQLSKYNDCFREPDPALFAADKRRILVVDQTRGDLSIEKGLLSPQAFPSMLQAAREENPGAQIFVKTHPDVLAGKRKSCFGDLRNSAEVTLIADRVNPQALLKHFERVYVGTSQLGFEALLAGVPVSCFGMPFYAGWGQSDDRASCPRRTRTRTLEQIFAAAYLLYARYLDPRSGTRGEFEDVLEHFARQANYYQKNRGTLYCFGFRRWKHGYIRRYLCSPGNRVEFLDNPTQLAGRELAGDTRLVIWGQRGIKAAREVAEQKALPLLQIEDGFLRSVGLGSDMVDPASLVVDPRGLYYDPQTPSELEELLQNADISPEEILRAQTLRQAILDQGVSKYMFSDAAGFEVPTEFAGRRVVLVPGQVEDDASVLLGSPRVRSNAELLAAARESRPDACIVYKPHPDVLSGNRKGAIAADRRRELCDLVAEHVDLHDCLQRSDEVHTMTSLVGFEALLRGKQVVVYGQPFYSGWGLTEDRHPLARRTRRRSLDELVAATLLRYPRYVDPQSGLFVAPETIVEQLARVRATPGQFASGQLKVSWTRRQLRKLANILPRT